MSDSDAALGEPLSVIRRAPFSDNPLVGTRGLRTQQLILDAALKAFGDVGYHRTSIERIATDAGCSRVAFYQYFSDKADVFRLLAVQVDRQVNASIDRLGPVTPDAEGWEALRSWVERYAEVRSLYEPVFRAFRAAVPESYPTPRVLDAFVDVMHRSLFGLQPETNVHDGHHPRPPRLPFGPVMRSALAQGRGAGGPAAASGKAYDQLLEAGRRVFIERGYHGTRARERDLFPGTADNDGDPGDPSLYQRRRGAPAVYGRECREPLGQPAALQFADLLLRGGQCAHCHWDRTGRVGRCPPRLGWHSEHW